MDQEEGMTHGFLTWKYGEIPTTTVCEAVKAFNSLQMNSYQAWNQAAQVLLLN